MFKMIAKLFFGSAFLQNSQTTFILYCIHYKQFVNVKIQLKNSRSSLEIPHDVDHVLCTHGIVMCKHQT